MMLIVMDPLRRCRNLAQSLHMVECEHHGRRITLAKWREGSMLQIINYRLSW